MVLEPSITPQRLVETSKMCMLLNKNQRSNPRKILFTGKPKTMARVDLNSWELRCVHLVQTPLEDHSVLLTPKSEELSMLQIKTQLLVEMLVMIDQFLSINKSVIKVANRPYVPTLRGSVTPTPRCSIVPGLIVTMCWVCCC